MSNNIPKISDEEFVKMFGWDKETYDKILCENEYRILKKRDTYYDDYDDENNHNNNYEICDASTNNNICPYSFIGKYLIYSGVYINFKNVLISDIRIARDYSFYSETYYSLFTKDENGKEKWLIDFTKNDFIDSNMFTS